MERNLTATPVSIRIEDYIPLHQPWFETLNRTWIEEHFWMEPIDFQVLQHPDQHIIAYGGAILMAYAGEEIVGTVALKFVSPGIFEFTKMAVDERHRGQKIGQILALAAIQNAKAMGARKIILYSSTKLQPALSLYRKIGFKDVPVDGPYKRSDVKMELSFED
jgi:GNAT superfamily N-acetyltransferase